MKTRSFQHACPDTTHHARLIDLTEIAEILHVSPERADQLAEGVVFPPTVDDRDGERLWRRADFELWARAIPPRVWPPERVASRDAVESLSHQD